MEGWVFLNPVGNLSHSRLVRWVRLEVILSHPEETWSPTSETETFKPQLYQQQQMCTTHLFPIIYVSLIEATANRLLCNEAKFVLNTTRQLSYLVFICVSTWCSSLDVLDVNTVKSRLLRSQEVGGFIHQTGEGQRKVLSLSLLGFMYEDVIWSIPDPKMIQLWLWVNRNPQQTPQCHDGPCMIQYFVDPSVSHWAETVGH